MVLLREKGTTADCLQIMAYSINCHAILLLQIVRLYITPLCIYRDPAHPLGVHLQGPFKGDRATDEPSQGCCRAGFWRHYKLLCLLGLKKKIFK